MCLTVRKSEIASPEIARQTARAVSWKHGAVRPLVWKIYGLPFLTRDQRQTCPETASNWPDIPLVMWRLTSPQTLRPRLAWWRHWELLSLTDVFNSLCHCLFVCFLGVVDNTNQSILHLLCLAVNNLWVSLLRAFCKGLCDWEKFRGVMFLQKAVAIWAGHLVRLQCFLIPVFESLLLCWDCVWLMFPARTVCKH